MSRKPGIPMEKIFIGHWRWLQAQGPSYKQQAASAKLQAASLTRDLYCVTVSYKRKDKKL
jgi:chitinase